MPHLDIGDDRLLDKQIHRMIRAHELLLDILRSPNLAADLESLKNDDIRKRIAADPLKAARDAGMHLPDEGVGVYIPEFAEGWEAEVHIKEGHSLLIAGFNNRKGFYLK